MVKIYRRGIIKASLLILALVTLVFSTGCISSAEADAWGWVHQNVIGKLDAGDNKIINVDEPEKADDAATKGYVDNAIASIPGEGTYWDDLRAPVNMGKLKGTADPTWTANAGGQTLLFPMNDDKEVFFILQIPHAYIEGTDIVPHVHWVFAANRTDETVRWGLEYGWYNDGDNVGATDTIYCLTDHCNNDALDLYRTDFPAIDGTGKEISSILNCRLFRDADAVSDNYSNNVYLFEFDVHFQTDGRGSGSEGAK